MRLVLFIVAVVLAILAAILGWNFAPHHSFSLVAAALACIAGALALGEPRPVVQ